MGTHLKVLNESYPMNTNMAGLGLDGFGVFVPWKKVTSGLDGLESQLPLFGHVGRKHLPAYIGRYKH